MGNWAATCGEGVQNYEYSLFHNGSSTAFKTGTVSSTSTSTSYTTAATDVGDTITAQVSACDAFGDCNPASATGSYHVVCSVSQTTPSMTNGSGPTGTGLSATHGTPSTNCSAGPTSWSYTYHWYHTTPGGTKTGIGSNSASYSTAASDVGDTVTADVSAVGTWSSGNTETGSALAATGSYQVVCSVSQTTPSMTNGSGPTGTGLSATHGTPSTNCSAGPTSWSYTYHWYHTPPGGSKTVVGSNSATYPTAASDVGDTITADVTAVGTWSSGNTETGSALAATGSYQVVCSVSQTAPSMTPNGNGKIGTSLTATHGTPSTNCSAGPTSWSYKYQWHYADGTSIGTNSSTYSTVAADLGATIKVDVTATGTWSSGNAYSGTATTASDSYLVSPPPSNTQLPSLSGRAAVGSSLAGADGTWSSAITDTVSRQWQACGYSSTVLSDNPVHWWRLGDSSVSQQGARDEMLTANGAYSATGVVYDVGPGGLDRDPNSAVTLDGSSGYINVPSGVQFDSGDFTIEGWFKTSSTADQQIWSSGSNGGNQHVSLFLTGGQVQFEAEDAGGSSISVTSTGTYDDGAWHQVAAVRSGNTLTLYMDGGNPISLSEGSPGLGDVDAAGTTARIGDGTFAPNNGYFFQGSLDEIAVYTHALSASQISAHQDAGVTLTSSCQNISGQTAASYALRDSDYANKVRLEVTDCNADGCSTVDSPLSDTIAAADLGSRREYTAIQQPLTDQESLSVNVANGNLTLTADDLNLPGIAGFDLDYPRYYNSLYSTSSNAPVDLLAPGWETTPTLNVLASGDVGYTGPSGYEVEFTPSGSSYTAPPGVDATLTQNSDGSFKLSFDQTGSVQDFSADGVLTDYKDKNGNTISFNRSGGQLTSITDSYGHTINFTYNSDGQLTEISAPCKGATCTYDYGYDSSGNLTSFTDPNGKKTSYAYNTGGLLTQVTDPLGNATSISYDANHRVSSIQSGLQLDPTSGTYDCPSGGTCPKTTFSYDVVDGSDSFCAGAATTDVLAPDQQSAGNPSRYCFDSSLRVTGIEAPDGTETLTDYSNANGGSGCSDDQPCSTTDWFDPSTGNGNRTTYTYDTTHPEDMLSEVQPSGATTTYVYGDPNHPFYPTSVTAPPDASGHRAVTTYTYDDAGNTTETDVDSVRQSAFTYNAKGQISGSEDGDNNWTGFTYDSNGNVASQTTGMALSGGVPTCPTGSVCPETTYSYDNANRVVTETAPLGNVSGANPADYTTTTSYDNDGRVLSVKDPLGHTSSYTYDGAGNPTSLTDGNGNRTVSMYDANNQLTSQQSGLEYDASTGTYDCPSGDTCPTTTYTYDANGNKLTETDPNGNSTLYTYNSNNQMTSEQTGMHYDASTQTYTCPVNDTCPTTHYTYDANGNQASATNADGNSTLNTYDDNQRLTSQQSGLTYDSSTQTYNCPSGDTCPTTKYGYDAAGNRTSVTDPDGNSTVYTYDANNRVTSVQTGMQYDSSTQTYTCPTNSNCPITSYTYDRVGNEATVTDPDGNATVYTYDASNRLASERDGMTYNSSTQSYNCPANDSCPTTTYGYDANGNKSSTLQPSGDTISYSYNHDNQLTKTSYSDSTPTISYTYDSAGNRTSMTDGAGTVNYTYNNTNQLLSSTRGNDTFSYSYDPAGNITKRNYPNGTVANYAYNQNEQLSSVTSDGNTTSYTYDSAGNVLTTSLPNGYIETRNYDNAGRLEQVGNARNGSALSDFAYTIDPAGNPTEVVQTGALSSTTTYTYDNNTRLIDACYQATCNESAGSNDPYIHYTYDKAGNRLTETRPSGTTNYTYNNLNELLTAGPTTYTYDANGNETAAGSRTFNFNAANQLITSTNSGATTTYTYDGDGNRDSATTGGSTTNYLWDTNGSLPQLALERDGSGTVLRSYLYGTRRISMTSGGNPFYYLYDALGSVVNLTSSAGVTEWTYSYDPFGAIRTQTQNDSNAPVNAMQFHGEFFDSTTGLYDLRARQYDASDGRFLSDDPVSASIGIPELSAYIYADDQPTTRSDPSGMMTCAGGGGPCGGINGGVGCYIGADGYCTSDSAIDACPLRCVVVNTALIVGPGKAFKAVDEAGVLARVFNSGARATARAADGTKAASDAAREEIGLYRDSGRHLGSDLRDIAFGDQGARQAASEAIRARIGLAAAAAHNTLLNIGGEDPSTMIRKIVIKFFVTLYRSR